MRPALRSPRCEEFHRNPTTNPDTRRRIQPGGDVYRRLVRECGLPPTRLLEPILGPIPPYIQRPTFQYPTYPVSPGINQGRYQTPIPQPRPQIEIPLVTPQVDFHFQTLRGHRKNIQLEREIMRELQNTNMMTKGGYERNIHYYPLTHGDVNEIGILMLLGAIGVLFENIRYNIVGYIMLFKSREFVRETAILLGFDYLEDDIHVFYNLIYFLTNNASRILTLPQIRYISGLSKEELLLLFPQWIQNDYYNHDRDALLSAAVTGKLIPRRLSINNQDRYEEVTQYPPNVVWNMFAYRKPADRHINGYEGPYDYIATIPRTVIDDIYLAVNVNNVDDLIETYGIVFSSTNTKADNPQYKLMYFLQQISNYENVFTRNPGILPPPNLQNIDRETHREIETVLSRYTTKELLDAYEYQGTWENRLQLIIGVIREGNRGAIWAWRHKNCKNDDTYNIVETELHGDMDKDDPLDPTLSYGVQANYRCYQISELTEMFEQYPEQFTVPDINLQTNRGIDPTTGLEYSNQFPLQSIGQLLELLEEGPVNDNIMALINIIRTKLQALTDEGIRITRLRNEFNAFMPEQQYHAKLFIVWLFLYGNWMRFWKGPGNPWPYNVRGNDVCVPASRDEHIFIQNNIVNRLIETDQADPMLINWIRQLPTVRYDFNTGNVTFRQELMTTLRGYLIGNECMGFGGDRFLQTGYYLVVNLLGANTRDQFSRIVNDMLPVLLDMEREIVREQLDENGELARYVREQAKNRLPIENEVEEKLRVLRERQVALNRPFQPVGNFEPNRVGANKHEYRFGYGR